MRKSHLLALVTTSVALSFAATTQVQAAIVTYDFTLNLTDGVVERGLYGRGNFSFNAPTTTNFTGNIPTTNFFLEPIRTPTPAFSAFNSPPASVNFQSGVFQGINWKNTRITRTPVPSSDIDITETNSFIINNQTFTQNFRFSFRSQIDLLIAAGDVIYAQRNPSTTIPESIAVWGLSVMSLAFLLNRKIIFSQRG